MKNYDWYNFAKKTKEYSAKLEECHHGFSLIRTINNFKPSCIELNKQFDGMANSLAWYAELYNIKGEGENNFLNRVKEFGTHKDAIEHEGIITLLWLAGGTLSLLIGGTVPCMSYIACTSCYEKFTDKPYAAATTITIGLLAAGLGMILYGSDRLESSIMSRDEKLIDSYIQLASVIDKFEYKPEEHLTPQHADPHGGEL